MSTNEEVDEPFPVSNIRELTLDAELTVVQFIVKYIYTGIVEEDFLFPAGNINVSRHLRLALG